MVIKRFQDIYQGCSHDIGSQTQVGKRKTLTKKSPMTFINSPHSEPQNPGSSICAMYNLLLSAMGSKFKIASCSTVNI